MTDSSTRKLETLGSSFSNETALAGCLRLNATIRKILSIHKKGCSTNPVGEKSPTGFFTCKKEKSRL